MTSAPKRPLGVGKGGDVQLARPGQIHQIADHRRRADIDGGAVARQSWPAGRRSGGRHRLRQDADGARRRHIRDEDAAVALEDDLAGQPPAILDGLRLQEEIVLGRRRRRFVQKAHAAAAAGAATAALRIQAQAGRLHRVQERRTHRRFDL